MMRTGAIAKYRALWIAAAVLAALPLAMPLFGLTINTASVTVILAIAAVGLNILVGYTGLTSFGQAAWLGIGAYAAAIAQKDWLHGQILLPIVIGVAFVALLSLVVGFMILRRRGVYFALLTLALSALAYAVAFRWTALTGGEDGLGGLERGRIGPVSLDSAPVWYALVAAIALGVLYVVLRVVRSPFGHVLVAIRENQQRATFQGYAVDRYKLGAFVLSASVTALAGALLGFQNYLVSAEGVSVAFSGELLAMVVIGGMRHILGPALGALFFVLFRELFSMWSGNWLLWFGLVFVGFVLYSPGGLVGIWARLRRRLRPPPEEAAAMSARKIDEGAALPGFLRPDA
ncbi:MAG TPA: branched-chain amino acid ABC transporter permease, partial [Burkholderiales bacterium]|nr:branched-chain amino acid ABC transporter permease [Burkholderiales bacterium]